MSCAASLQVFGMAVPLSHRMTNSVHLVEHGLSLAVGYDRATLYLTSQIFVGKAYHLILLDVALGAPFWPFLGGGGLPCACPARYVYSDFPRFSPQVHHYPMKPWAVECDDGRVGERPRTQLPSTRGSKGNFGGTVNCGEKFFEFLTHRAKGQPPSWVPEAH